MSSYCLELIVICVWQRNDFCQNFTMRTMLMEVVNQLIDINNIAVCWDQNYTAHKFTHNLNK